MTEFTNCEIATVREDGEFVISRVKRAGGLTPWLMVSLAARQPTPASVANLANAYARREEKHPAWTTQPLDLVHYEGKLSLIFHDPGGEFLDGLLADLRRCKIAWESGDEPDVRSLIKGQRISGTGSWSWNLKTGKIIWSREMWRIFGLAPYAEEMTFDLFLTRIHPEDRASVQQAVYQAIRAHDPFDHEYRIVLPCGEVRYIQGSGRPVFRSSGDVEEYIGAVMDITVRKLEEYKLRRSEAFLAQAQRVTQTSSLYWKPSTGEIVWSEESYRLMEYPLGTVPTVELIMNRVHPEDRAQVEEMVGRSAGEGARMDLKHRLIMPDGRIKHIHIIARNIAPEGEIYEIVGAVSDISEQHKTEAALKGAIARSRESEIQLRTIVDSIPTLAWRAGPDGSAEFFNERWLKYTGLSKEQADGVGWTAAVHPDDVEKLHGCLSKIITTKCEGEIEARLRRFDGEYRWFLFRAAPCLDEEENIHNLYGTNTDIEDRHASEHVVRGHLSALTQMLELLAHERDPDQLPRHVLNTILTQLGAASVSIWERHGDRLDLIGVEEEGKFRTGAEAGYFEGSFPVDGEAPPLWVEALRTGTHFVIEDIDREPHRLILADGRMAVWYRRDLKPPFAHLEAHLSAQGVRGLLISPMFLAGRLSGIIKIRFKGTRVFGREEIELTKALGQQAMLALQVMHLSEESRRAAVVAERNRMARDIHDTLAQGFTGVIAQLQAAKGAAAKNGIADATEYIEQAEALARSSLGEARRSVRALRPRSLREGGLCIALERLFNRMSLGASPKAVFQSHGKARAMPLEWEEELLRIAQESLTNTINHANASQFEAVLDFEPDQIRLRLADNGRGFNPNVEHEGLGLIGMKERVDRMGGRFILRTQPGRGTEISILLRHPKE